MPRKPRIISSSGIYHIILRSINQHIIFEEDSDYQKFLLILLDCKTNFNIDIYAYCLMDNHIHLMLHSNPENLSPFFQSVGARFVRWYNKKYSRSGHLFQDRYHSVAIENTSQYLTTLIYIHNNPVKAAICPFPSDYRWSSFYAFYGQKNPLVSVSYSYNIAGSKEYLLKYFEINGTISDSMPVVKTKHFVSDEKALRIFKTITHLSSSSEAINLTKSQRNDYIRILVQNGLTQKQIARMMDISVSTIKRACQK